MTPKKIFETGILYHHYANTAYPLTPVSFKNFKIQNQEEYIPCLKKEWDKTDKLSLYVHIPFCKVRCKFCEYVVLENSDDNIENEYINLLLKEIDLYKSIIKDKKIIGYDLGGGTPTKLSIENLQIITSALTSSFNFDDNTVFSIETTPIIAASEPDKIKAVYNMGYKRISMGIQTVSERLLNELGREGATHIYEQAVKNIRNAGYNKFNIDLMYGFLHQNEDDFISTLKYAINLNPDYITLYRNRYKGTKLEDESGGVSLYKIIKQYRLAYTILNENGYCANIGKNTFSKIDNDYGTSDYLTKRVIDGVPYVGIGLGAQSFGMDYLAYNDGAASKQFTKYKEKLESGNIPIQDIYSLNIEESIGKMVSVAFYFGFIDLDSFKKRFNLSFIEHFRDEVEFVINEGLMEIKGNRLYLTNRGSDYINGVIPLFYSKRSKKELIELMEKSKTDNSGEQEFLKVYNIKEYEHPSLASDIVVLNRGENNNDISLLMIRRGEHPFMNSWALPGGFVKPDESAEDAASRELYEETGVHNLPMRQLKLFSKPNRDPRGWIISCAFLSVIKNNNVKLKFGEDAIDSRFFEVTLTKKKLPLNTENFKSEIYNLILKNNNIELSAMIKKESILSSSEIKENYIVTESNGIAFDHAEIIIIAIEEFLRNYNN